jgi:hypothetical protein
MGTTYVAVEEGTQRAVPEVGVPCEGVARAVVVVVYDKGLLLCLVVVVVRPLRHRLGHPWFK